MSQSPIILGQKIQSPNIWDVTSQSPIIGGPKSQRPCIWQPWIENNYLAPYM